MKPDTQPEQPSSPTSWRIILLLLVLLAVYVGTLYRTKLNHLAGTTHIGVGNPLTDLDLAPLLNTQESLKLADLRGKVALVNYWGPWCGPCLAEFPELAALEKKYRNHPQVRILMVSSDGGAGQAQDELAYDTQAVLDRQRVNPPIYHDPTRKTMSAVVTSARLEQFGFPTTILVDSSGIICGVWQGYDPYYVDEMQRMIERLTK